MDQNFDPTESQPSRQEPARDGSVLEDPRAQVADGLVEATATALDRDLSRADQVAADADSTASSRDQSSAEVDQELSDRDQESADREHAATRTTSGDAEYEATRAARALVASQRRATYLDRNHTSIERDATADTRDRVAAQRDQRAVERDGQAAATQPAMAALNPSMGIQLEQLRRHAAADRADAARDRAHAARDRAEAARERDRLQAELLTAHFDGLTGAFQREMGMVTLEHEVARARRGDGTFALGFIDVDDLKRINDRQGHAAGDEALRAVVKVVRSHLRSFDPVLRYGGDEFVAGMTGMDLEGADARFAAVQLVLESEAGIRISVGLAALQPGETVSELIGRADTILYGRRNRSAAHASETAEA